METIYTIPINESFEYVAQNPGCGCPLCHLYNILEDNEVQIITGGAMMDPDIRIKTNHDGFCIDHYRKMALKGNKLQIALMLQSHIQEITDGIKPGLLFASAKAHKTADRLAEINNDCYLCNKMNNIFKSAAENLVYLWATSDDFKAILKKQPYFCMNHYYLLLDSATEQLKRSDYLAFVKELYNIEEKHLKNLKTNIDGFVNLFDYRTEESEPDESIKNAISDSVRFLTSKEISG